MNKKVIIGLTILIILLIGTSYAWWQWNSSSNTNISLTVDGINVTYNGGSDITGINLIPVSSKEKGVEDNTAILKTVTASSNQTLYMDLNLELETLPDGLKDSSFVWELYNGNTLVSNGNFASNNQGDVIKLAKGQTITSTTTTYNLYIWIDGTVPNPSSMMNQTFKFVLSANGTDQIPVSNLDTSGANSPDLVDGLIPVMYSNDKWVKADSTNLNETYKWYDYNNKQWANAVLVSSTNRESYKTAEAGEMINDSDILAYYVWIPRYKYKVWNINKEIGVDSYNAQTTGIDIVFETETATTGTIDCKTTPYSFAAPTATTTNETCTGNNGDYYTHPAFTFGSDELRGIWVGKFELANTTSNIRIKENLNSLLNTNLTTLSSSVQSMSASSNEYGLNNTTADSHMIKNIEWGAVAYLTNSNHGRCSGVTCTEVGLNSYFYDMEEVGYKTGCGPQSEGSDEYSYTVCNSYNTELGQLASTTGNIYGIYDMSGGAFEYVMGNMSSATGSYTYNAQYGGNNFNYSTTTAKYIDTYAYGTSQNDQTAYNIARLGDATGEVITTRTNIGWYNDYAIFTNSSAPWFRRGMMAADGSYTGVFSFNYYSGIATEFGTGRAVLVLS